LHAAGLLAFAEEGVVFACTITWSHQSLLLL
jgi:hypothetical protein